MAEQADKESKTEEATEKKIRDAVEKGQLPFAKEVPVVGSFLAILVFLIFIAQSGAIELAGFLSMFLERPESWSLATEHDAVLLYRQVFLEIAKLLASLMALLVGAGIAASVFQNVPRFVGERIQPKLSRVSPKEGWSRLFGQKGLAEFAKSLGKLLLLARRLCERGCGFVTVTTNFVWDMHADQNNATMEEGMRYMGPPLDHALSAFVDDLHARGLEEKILLVACGEMGRSPRINGQGGRDHWGNLGPLLLTGGGLPSGQVIGLSNRDGSAPQSQAVTPRPQIPTIMHTLFDVGQLRLVPSLPREFSQTMIGWEPIPGLFA